MEHQSQQQTQDCIICLTPFPIPNQSSSPYPPFALPCAHAHCPSCLVRSFLNATKSLPFSPAICCSPAAILLPAAFRPFFSSLQISDYRAKLAEYLSPTKLYCHHPTCSAFIPAILQVNGKQAKCRVCSRKTCVLCQGRAHMGGCPDLTESESDDDDDDHHHHEGAEEERRRRKSRARRQEKENVVRAVRAQVALERRRRMAIRNEQLSMSLIKTMGWKRCPDCKRTTEKTEGCNHIRCLCGCHWCYRCGKAPYGAHGPCAM